MAWAWLRTASWRERAGIAAGLPLALVVLAATVVQGLHLGDRVWRPGWLCGNDFNQGNPICIRDPHGGLAR